MIRKSHLLQMRGLKLTKVCQCTRDAKVASFTDAWIETNDSLNSYGSRVVASFTDAWIETTPTSLMYANWQSHLLQMRGLKQLAP